MNNSECQAKNKEDCWKHGSHLGTLTPAKARQNAALALQDGKVDAGEATTHLRTLAYFDTEEDAPIVKDLQKASGVTVAPALWNKWETSAKTSKAVFAFEQSYTQKYGAGSNEDKELLIQSKFKMTPTRYYQMLNSNPVVEHARKQVEAEIPPSADFLSDRERGKEVTQALQTRLYGGTQKLPQPKRTLEQALAEFDIAEAMDERDNADLQDKRRIWIDQAAQRQADINYYTEPEPADNRAKVRKRR
jgi:hypothetical protein